MAGIVTNEKWASLANMKVELVNLQKKCLIEEHDSKMQLMHKLKDLQIDDLELKNKLLKIRNNV